MNNNEIVEVTDATFDYEVLGADKPSLIYFTVLWSRECRDQLEILEDLADDYGEKVRFFKLDIEKNTRIKSRFNVRLAPTVVILRNGEEVRRFTTDIDPVELADYLDELLQDIKIVKKQAKEILGKVEKKTEKKQEKKKAPKRKKKQVKKIEKKEEKEKKEEDKKSRKRSKKEKSVE